MPRVALKLAYDGTRFSGSQVQPARRTVHSELAGALERLGEDADLIHWAGRTDAGVSALGNVVVVNVARVDPVFPRKLSFQMEDAWAWAQAEVPDDFLPRHAVRRHYRYHLSDLVDVKPFTEAMSRFVGTHDWSGFARVPDDANPERSVEHVEVRETDGLILVDVVGRNFLYNQVRRMVEAARRFARGELTLTAIEQALSGARPADLGVAPAEPLVLLDVEYRNVDFRPVDEKARASIFHHFQASVQRERARLAVMDTLLRGGPA